MSLAQLLIRRIALSGPISVAEYMSDCMLHPTLGYYTTRDPFGQAGDFITAPEISQMFGELLGLCLAQSWLDQGQPTPFTLAELGPGRGTLMADMLRVAAGVPGFVEAAQITLLEASPTLRATQAQTLTDNAPKWIDQIDDLPEAPLFVVANEFFDALPVRQFVRSGPHWRERQVGLTDGKLAFGLGQAQAQPALDARFAQTDEGALVEDSPALSPIASTIGQRIHDHGGMGLIIDYGDWHSQGDTLQAMRAHQPVDPLSHPGQADLTAHVDFEALTLALPCAHTRLATQGVFLERLGITQRAQQLAASQPGSGYDAIAAAHRRLTHPDEMGTLFKVLGLYPAHANPPPGLET